MPRRTNIDWEAIERDYRAGQLSIRQIAVTHNVSVSAIVRHAKRNGWSRDLTKEVRAQTKARLIELAKADAQAKGTEGAQVVLSGVDAAAQTNTTIIRGHRKDIRMETERSEQLGAMLDVLIGKVSDLRDLAAAIGAHEALVRSRARLIALERQAFGIDEADNGGGIDELIARFRGVTLRNG